MDPNSQDEAKSFAKLHVPSEDDTAFTPAWNSASPLLSAIVPCVDTALFTKWEPWKEKIDDTLFLSILSAAQSLSP